MSASDSYFSIAHGAEVTQEIKKSIFIGNAEIVTTQKEAEDFIAKVRAKHPQARHCCYAYMLRSSGISKASDDGEPQGTAGMPMLEIIKKHGVCDIAVTVTRYFGGILLGAGGLCRAYGSTCAQAIDAGGAVEYVIYEKASVECDYAEYPKIEYEFKRALIPCSSPVFTDRVTFVFMTKKESGKRIRDQIRDITSGKATVCELGSVYAPSNAQQIV